MTRTAIALLCLVPLALPAAAAADTITVTTTADQNDGCAVGGCSLREAVADAVSGDTVHLPASASAYQISTAPVTVNESLTIQGDGASATIVSGTDSRRPFNIASGPGPITVTFLDLRIRDGLGSVDGPLSYTGGAMQIRPAAQPITVNITRLRIVDNNIVISAGGTGGGGGAIGISDAGGGAGTTLTITDSTLARNKITAASNSSTVGGAISAATPTATTITVVNSTISGNEAEVTGTSTARGGGIALIEGIGGDVQLHLRQATIAANVADPGSSGTSDGGSIYRAGGPTVSAAASIITGGAAQGTSTENCAGVTLPGDNVENDDTCGTDLPNTDPELEPLGENGGPTPTHAIGPDSPANGVGLDGSCQATDQRGVARAPAGCDAGAYEAAPPGLAVATASATETTATLTGSVSPFFSPTTYRFEYGPTDAYGSTTPERSLDPVLGPLGAEESIAGLVPGTTYHYRLTGSNENGTATSADATFTTTSTAQQPPPGPPGLPLPPVPPPGGGVVPLISVQSLTLTPRAFRPAAGTLVRYALSAAGTARFRVQRPRAGRRVGGRCVRRTRANRRARRCTRWVNVRSAFSRTSVAGLNSFRFDGRVGGRRLARGPYRLAARALNAAGRLGPQRTARFRILPPRRRR
jgi:CSLREA domain-containing protein